jgi:uncharacterized protein YodC (DUF2158 family)
MSKEFKVGEVVTLKSGGPEMTVSDTRRLSPKDVMVTCQWFGGRKLERGTFPEASLIYGEQDD